MKLIDLHLKNFRNYLDLDLELHPQLNIFLGANAQGKTNILESIYFLATTRSHRTHHDKELINWEQNELKVSASVEKLTSKIPLEVRLDNKGRTAFVNHLKETRLADYIGQLNLILFAPEDLELVKGAPSVRRRFLDMEIGQIRSTYLYDLMRYNHVLKERNALVKKDSKEVDLTLLDVLDELLVEHGTKVMQARDHFLADLATFAAEVHSQLTHGAEELQIIYQPRVHQDSSITTDAENFAEQLADRRSVDLMRHQTTVGPHRDDVSFLINGINVQDFGSQGQQRTVALSVKLAEIELIHQEKGDYPILLLDDVMSELDNTRQLDLMETALSRTQTFITTTSLDQLKQLPEQLSIFKVKQGQIKAGD